MVRGMGGSSPRMRGTQFKLRRGGGERGIIPAYAGNTAALKAMMDTLGDHPRVCGEHSVRMMRATALRGSSPRMRGTPGAGRLRDIGYGIIPAYAGNTMEELAGTTGEGDHPRVCGEHQNKDFYDTQSEGSSPRMRGTRVVCSYSVHRFGIIPAYAGNTYMQVSAEICCRDHPRVCGEHYDGAKSTLRPLGSSPRMRGTPDTS